MDLLNRFMKHIVLALTTLLFAFGLNMATAHEAEAGNFEIGAAFGWFGEVDDGADRQGFQFQISPGYRFLDWVGIYIDQGFGGLFWNYDYDDRPGHRAHHKYSWFSGQTVLNAKFFLPVSALELWGRVGIGAYYEAWDWDDDPLWHHHNHHDSEGAFAFKLGIGATFPITGMIGIGANFDYLLAAFDGGNDHFLDLQLHVVFKF